MVSLFRRTVPAVFGLDISASSVKLVELGRDRVGNLLLERCAMTPLERDSVTDGSMHPFEDVVGAVRRVISKSGTRTKTVAMALPASVVITKKAILPSGLTDQELEMRVEYEAQQHVSFQMDEVALDFCVAGPSAAAVDDVEVVIAASRKENVAHCQTLADALGLTPVVIDVASHAARRAARRVMERTPASGAGALVALLEIGASSTTLHVMRGDELVYERDHAFGGAQLTQMLVRRYGYTPEEAERNKRSGDLPGDFATAVLKPYRELLAQEIERALKFFFTSTPHNTVDQVLLGGGSASLPGLSEAVARHARFACQIVNPFVGMGVGPAVRETKLLRDAPAYLTACGLAMRRFLA